MNFMLFDDFNLTLGFQVDRVHFNGDVTVVIFSDGSKRIVRRNKDDAYDPDFAVCYAILKRVMKMRYLRELAESPFGRSLIGAYAIALIGERNFQEIVASYNAQTKGR